MCVCVCADINFAAVILDFHYVSKQDIGFVSQRHTQIFAQNN
jgi:hypothetical protein